MIVTLASKIKKKYIKQNPLWCPQTCQECQVTVQWNAVSSARIPKPILQVGELAWPSKQAYKQTHKFFLFWGLRRTPVWFIIPSITVILVCDRARSRSHDLTPPNLSNPPPPSPHLTRFVHLFYRCLLLWGQHRWAGIKSTDLSSTGPEFGSQHPPGSSRPPITPAPGDPTVSSDLQGNCTRLHTPPHTYMHIHSKNIF